MHSFISSPLQTAVAAVVSMGLAQALHLPDPYWAPISAIVCSLDAFEGATATARRRLLGTFLGVLLAALQISFTAYKLINYGLAIALLWLLCHAARLHPSAELPRQSTNPNLNPQNLENQICTSQTALAHELSH